MSVSLLVVCECLPLPQKTPRRIHTSVCYSLHYFFPSTPSPFLLLLPFFVNFFKAIGANSCILPQLSLCWGTLSWDRAELSSQHSPFLVECRSPTPSTASTGFLRASFNQTVFCVSLRGCVCVCSITNRGVIILAQNMAPKVCVCVF